MDPQSIVKNLRTEFSSGKTRCIKWRKEQLKGLIRMFDEQEDVFASALEEDLGKPRQESILMEIKFTQNLTIEALSNIDSWVKDEPADKSLVTLLDSVYCHYDPYGLVLILSPWNYPLQLCLAPLVGAIAAGNVAIVKPSEISPAVSDTLHHLLPKYVDGSCIKVLTGDVSMSQALLEIPFDKIFFTGSSNVGKIIASAAAKHLTPTTLELGGKSPVYFHEDLSRKDSKLKSAVKRLVWGKLANAGQTCVAPDYILVHKATEKKLIELIRNTNEKFYSEDPEFKDMGRIVNGAHFDRLEKIIATMPKTKCVVQGPVKKAEKLIGLHAYANVEEGDSAMEDEIFGPILPIITVESETEAMDFIKSRPKPLSLYVFTENEAIISTFVENTFSGSVCVNDVLVQLSVESLPFGGVGNSGYGAYHGKYSFECFSHKKSVLSRGLDFLGENIGAFRYPPYSDKKALWGSKVIRPISIPIGRTFFAYALATVTSFACGYLANSYFQGLPF